MRPTTGLPRRLLLPALSGALSYVACQLPEPAGDVGLSWGAGAIFGALILAPRARSGRQWLSLIVASTLIYRAAVWLAVALATTASWSEVVSCTVAGATAAPLLALLSHLLLREPMRVLRELRAILPGAAGGLLIGFAAQAGDGLLELHLPLLAGFVVWQAGYVAVQRSAISAPTRGRDDPHQADGPDLLVPGVE